MRVLRLVVTLGMFAAPTLSPAQTVEATRRQITALEEDWIKAVINRDAAAFNRLLAPNFVYTEDDRVYTRAQLIKEVVTSTDTVVSGRNEDLVIRVFGNTAIATGWLVLAGHNKGGRFERRYRYTDTWQRTDGVWRVIAAQDYLKP